MPCSLLSLPCERLTPFRSSFSLLQSPEPAKSRSQLSRSAFALLLICAFKLLKLLSPSHSPVYLACALCSMRASVPAPIHGRLGFACLAVSVSSAAWRKARRQGSLAALSKRRGPKGKPVNPLARKVEKLERENSRLEEELRKAHAILDVQGKVAGLLGLSFDDGKTS